MGDKTNFNKEEYEQLRSLLKETKSLFDLYVETFMNDLNALSINPSIREFMVTKTMEEIEAMSGEDLSAVYTKYTVEDKKEHVASINDSKILQDMVAIKKSVDIIEEMRAKMEEIDTECQNFVVAYRKYLQSDEYREEKQRVKDELKEKIAVETDPYKKSKLTEQLDVMESSDTLSFIFDDFIKDKNNIKNFTDIFFNDKKSEYIIERLNGKLKRFNLPTGFYKEFLYLEERYLDEMYHPFNNVFVFYVIRFISFADPSSKRDQMFIYSILTNLTNLFYNTFESDERRDEFLTIVKAFLFMFMEHYEEFVEQNITHPTHPVRLEREKEHDALVRAKMIKRITESGALFDETVSDDILRDYCKALDTIDENGYNITVTGANIEDTMTLYYAILEEELGNNLMSESDAELLGDDTEPLSIAEIEAVVMEECCDQVDEVTATEFAE